MNATRNTSANIMNHDALVRQLGSALPMMGARDLARTAQCLWFAIGANPNRVKKLAITLLGNGAYRVAAYRANGKRTGACLPFREVSEVHAESLHVVLENLIGRTMWL